MLDGVYRCDANGTPALAGAPAPTDEALQTVLHKIITVSGPPLREQAVLAP